MNLLEREWQVSAYRHRSLSDVKPDNDDPSFSHRTTRLPADVLSLLAGSEETGNPYLGYGDLDWRWVEDVDWAFSTSFDGPPPLLGVEDEHVLVLKEIDCWADVFLNGELVGSIGNQFREHRFVVTDRLREGQNDLLIYIHSARRVNEALEQAHGKLPAVFDSPRVHARRCQCWTGWDWAARMSSAGILGAVLLETQAPFRLESPFACVRKMAPCEPGAQTTEWAEVAAEITVVSTHRGQGRVLLELVDADAAVVARTETAITLTPGSALVRMALRVRNAHLWWPIGYGARPMYTVRFLLTGEDRAGLSFSADAEAQFAMRTAQVLRTRDAEGETFTPAINGVPIFCRGANWIPVRMLPGQVLESDYAHLIAAAAAAGMNCLRVWGGGVYERDIFYDMCDKAGILVWQDFMFACAAYPSYRDFLNEVELEADYQIKRLRNHPSLLLWCGNNENEWIHQMGGLRQGGERRVIGEIIWSTLLRNKVEELDPSRVYHQSSPFGRKSDDCNDQGSGDRHNWEVWGNWFPTDGYLVDKGRFISEFGFQSIPARESVAVFAPEATNVQAPQLLHHQKGDQGIERMARYALGLFHAPGTFEEWIETSQGVQAEVMRRAVEHWRRRKFDCSGALIWQYSDAYPALSWSMIDFFGRPKTVYDQARRFFAPILVSASLQIDGVEIGAFPPTRLPEVPALAPPEATASVFVEAEPGPQQTVSFTLINDTCVPLAGALAVRTLNADGTEVARVDIPVVAEPNTNAAPMVFTLDELQVTDMCSQYVHAQFEPDEASVIEIHKVADEFSRSIAAVREMAPPREAELQAWDRDSRTGLLAEFAEPDFSAALQAKVLLVEQIFFRS